MRTCSLHYIVSDRPLLAQDKPLHNNKEGSSNISLENGNIIIIIIIIIIGIIIIITQAL